MNLSGKNINNNYIIREKIAEDSISTVWLAHSIFSAKKFIIKFFKKNIFEYNLESLAAIKNDIFNPNVINDEKILNPIELDEYEGNIFIAFEGREGETLYDYLTKKDNINSKIISKILNEVLNIIKKFHENDEYLCYISCKDILVESYYDSIQYLGILNMKYPVITKYFSLKEYNSIKKYLIKNGEKENKLLNQKNDLVMLGLLFYGILSRDLELKKFNFINFDKIINNSFFLTGNKTKFIRIISKLIDKESDYNNINDIINDLYNLKEDKKEIKTEVEKQKVEKKIVENISSDIFEDRRNYFEKLEEERKKRLELSKSDIRQPQFTEKGKKLQAYNKKLFEDRRDYFEKYEKERWNYLRKSSDDNTKHLDDLIDKTKAYLVNLQGKNKVTKDKIKHKKYFEEMSEKMKGYADSIKNDNIKYIEKVIKNKDNRLDYLKRRVTEAKKNLNSLSARSKEYFLDITGEAKKQINKKLNNNVKIRSNDFNNIIDDTLNYYNKIEDETNKIYKTIIKKSNKPDKNGKTAKKTSTNKKKNKKSKSIDIVNIKIINTNKNNYIDYLRNIKIKIFKILFYFKRLFLKI